MRILFLDDEIYRHEVFKKYVCQNSDYRIVCVKTVQECKEYLIDEEFDFIWLDHDLGGEVHVDSGREDCGMEIVRFLEKYRKSCNRIFVHTCNEPASNSMVCKLRENGYKAIGTPFIDIDWKNLLKTLEEYLK